MFIILVSLMMTLFSEKALISNRCISGLMPKLIKKSLTVANRELDHQRNFAACWVNCWLFQERSSQYISGGWIWWLSLTPRRLIWTNSSSLNYCVYLWLEFPFNNIGDHLVRQLRRVEGVLVLLGIFLYLPLNFDI